MTIKRIFSHGPSLGGASVLAIGALAIGAAVLATPANAQGKFDAAAYFKGKTIRLIIPSSPGGGADIRTRIFTDIARRKYFPGKPRFVVVNIPGAGGAIGIRRGMAAKPNGLTSVRVSRRFLLRELTGKGVKFFDSRKAIMLGADHNFQADIWYVRRDIAKSWQDVLKLGRKVVEGASDPQPTGGEMASLLGYPIRVVYGYGGAAEVRAALGRNEIEATDLAGPHMLTLYPELVKKKAWVPIFWWGRDPRTDPQTMKYLNALGAKAPPYFFDVIKASDDDKSVFDVGTALPTATTFFPPGVRKEIVAAWQDAMAKTYEDPEMKKRALAAGTSVAWVPATKIKDVMKRGRTVVKNPKHRKMLKSLLGQR
jgi:hypothetical protein